MNVQSTNSSNRSIGSVGSQPDPFSQDSLTQTIATLNAFSEKVYKKPIDAAALQQTIDFVSQKGIEVGKEVTYKRSSELPYTVKINKEGTVVIHLTHKNHFAKGYSKTAKLACVIKLGEVKPAVKLTTQFTGRLLNGERKMTAQDIADAVVSAKVESESLNQLKGPQASRIIQLFAEVLKENKHVMYEEIGIEGDLFNAIKGGRLTAEEKSQIFKDIVDGLVQIEQAGLMHRDIKLDNILLTQENGKLRAKICDFGYAKSLKETWTGQGTPDYIAPELWNAVSSGNTSGVVNNKVDTYSAGVILGYLLPYPMSPTWTNEKGQINNLDLLTYKARTLRQRQNPAEHLVGGLLEPDPTYRYTPQRAKEYADQITPLHFRPVRRLR